MMQEEMTQEEQVKNQHPVPTEDKMKHVVPSDAAEETTPCISPDASQASAPSKKTKARWYVVHVYSGSENRVVREVKEKAEKEGLSELFEELLVPQEEVTEVRRGVKRNVKKVFFSGYVLVRMVLNDQTMHLIRGVDRVTGFLGDKEQPSPLPEADVARLKGRVEETKEAAAQEVSFAAGDHVKVIDGAFKGVDGVVEVVLIERQRLKITAMFFGRATPIEVNFVDVEKA